MTTVDKKRKRVGVRSKQSPRDLLYDMYRAYSITQALYVVAKLGVADYLRDGLARSDELAKEVGANPRALFRVMRHLATVGVFTQDRSRRFGLTPLGELLCTDHPESMRHGVIMNGEEIYRAVGELLHTVRTGETAFNHLYGKGHFEYLAEHPEASWTFNKAMAQSLRRQKNPIESYNFKDKLLVVDIGGGRGDLIALVLVANPEMEGILFDLPQGTAEAQSLLKAKGVEERCQVKTGSFFDSIPAGGDVYMLSRILHDWPDEKAAVILANCRKSIKEGGTLLIRENVLPEQNAEEKATELDVIMLAVTGGEERSESEWKNLLKSAQFKVTRFHRKKGELDLIEAKPI